MNDKWLSGCAIYINKLFLVFFVAIIFLVSIREACAYTSAAEQALALPLLNDSLRIYCVGDQAAQLYQFAIRYAHNFNDGNQRRHTTTQGKPFQNKLAVNPLFLKKPLSAHIPKKIYTNCCPHTCEGLFSNDFLDVFCKGYQIREDFFYRLFAHLEKQFGVMLNADLFVERFLSFADARHRYCNNHIVWSSMSEDSHFGYISYPPSEYIVVHNNIQKVLAQGYAEKPFVVPAAAYAFAPCLMHEMTESILFDSDESLIFPSEIVSWIVEYCIYVAVEDILGQQKNKALHQDYAYLYTLLQTRLREQVWGNTLQMYHFLRQHIRDLRMLFDPARTDELREIFLKIWLWGLPESLQKCTGDFYQKALQIINQYNILLYTEILSSSSYVCFNSKKDTSSPAVKKHRIGPIKRNKCTIAYSA